MKVFPAILAAAVVVPASKAAAQTAYYVPVAAPMVYTVYDNPQPTVFAPNGMPCFRDPATGEMRTREFPCEQTASPKAPVSYGNSPNASRPTGYYGGEVSVVEYKTSRKYRVVHNGNDMYAFNEVTGQLSKFVQDLNTKEWAWVKVTDAIGPAGNSVKSPPPVTN